MELITERMEFKGVIKDLSGLYSDIDSIAAAIMQEHGKEISDLEFIRKGIQAEGVEVDEDERTITSYVSTAAVDRDDEVLAPKGVLLAHYIKNPVVLWAHKYDVLPVGKSLWIKTNERGLISKTQYAKHGFADDVYQYRKDGFPMAESVGFIPLSMIEGKNIKDANRVELGIPEDVDLSGAKRIYDKWVLLEYSDVPVPANPEALELAKSKGLVQVPVADDVKDNTEETKTSSGIEYKKEIHATVDTAYSKAADLDGRPSVNDIYGILTMALDSMDDKISEIYYYAWDMYPHEYPNGAVVVEVYDYKARNSVLAFYDYAIDFETGAVDFSNPREAESGYIAKHFKAGDVIARAEKNFPGELARSGLVSANDTDYKMLADEVKAGRVLSEKNRTLIKDTVSKMEGAGTALNELLTATESSVDAGDEESVEEEKQIDISGIDFVSTDSCSGEKQLTAADITDILDSQIKIHRTQDIEAIAETVTNEIKRMRGIVR